MNKWLVVLISSIAGFFLFGGIGAFAVVSTTQGEVLVEGDASESLTFKGEWDKYYDIYAEDRNIIITFETSQTHDPDFTYLLRCGVDDDSAIGISGDCGDSRGSQYLVADFTVEATGVGDVTFNFEGTGEVVIVQSGLGGTLGSLTLVCLGCCLCPILIIISGVMLGKGKTQDVVVLNGNHLGYQQPISQQLTQQYTFNAGGAEQNNVPYSPPQQKNFSAWDSPSIAANNPPAHLQPTQIYGGYEWIEYKGNMYYRPEASNGEWSEFNG